MIMFPFHILPAVTVGLRQMVYEIGEEEGSLTVCVVLFGLTARNVSVFASTTESGDAEGMVTNGSYSILSILVQICR